MAPPKLAPSNTEILGALSGVLTGKTINASALGVSLGLFGPEFPITSSTPKDLAHPGTGKYPAAIFTDPTLINHTIYAPKSPPAGLKLPVIVWGEGGCLAGGTTYNPFLLEIASHGYLVLANGPPPNGPIALSPSGGINTTDLNRMLNSGQTKVKDLTDSIDWTVKRFGKKYGEIDTSKIAAVGQSCGGLEAYSASYHDDRVKLTILFNKGVLEDKRMYLLQELHAPVAYFLGGPTDIAYQNVSTCIHTRTYKFELLIMN
jgi:hypothetical protein